MLSLGGVRHVFLAPSQSKAYASNSDKVLLVTMHSMALNTNPDPNQQNQIPLPQTSPWPKPVKTVILTVKHSSKSQKIILNCEEKSEYPNKINNSFKSKFAHTVFEKNVHTCPYNLTCTTSSRAFGVNISVSVLAGTLVGAHCVVTVCLRGALTQELQFTLVYICS